MEMLMHEKRLVYKEIPKESGKEKTRTSADTGSATDQPLSTHELGSAAKEKGEQEIKRAIDNPLMQKEKPNYRGYYISVIRTGKPEIFESNKGAPEKIVQQNKLIADSIIGLIEQAKRTNNNAADFKRNLQSSLAGMDRSKYITQGGNRISFSAYNGRFEVNFLDVGGTPDIDINYWKTK